MFYNESRIVYFSIHRYEDGKFWPELRESDFDFIGGKTGKGFNFNIPLNTTGASDMDYLSIFHQVLLPMAYEVIQSVKRLVGRMGVTQPIASMHKLR